MKYRNKQTGAVIETNSVISGEAWEDITPPAQKQEAAAPVKAAAKTTAKPSANTAAKTAQRKKA